VYPRAIAAIAVQCFVTRTLLTYTTFLSYLCSFLDEQKRGIANLHAETPCLKGVRSEVTSDGLTNATLSAFGPNTPAVRAPTQRRTDCVAAGDWPGRITHV
jgi:hypothetical protein